MAGRCLGEMTFSAHLSLSLRHLGYSCFTPFHMLGSCLSINPKDSPSYKKSLDYPQEGHILLPSSALKAGAALPFVLWGYFVRM